MDKSKVSIVIPFYNTDKYMFERCIQSVLDQKYTEFECLIIDDGSKPDFKEFLDGFENKDDRIRVFHKKNGGLGNTRNFGVRKAVGDYMFFLDSDDYISPYTLEFGMRLASETDADLIVGGLKHVDIDESPVFKESSNIVLTIESNEDKEKYVMHLCGIKQEAYIIENGQIGPSACSRFIRRKIALDCAFENDKYWDEDNLFNIRLANKCKKILVVDVCWYAYVINSDSMIRSYAGDRTKEFQIRAKQEYYLLKDTWPNCMQGAYCQIWDGLLRYCRTDTFQNSNPNSKEVKYRNFCKAIDFDEFRESINNIDFNFENRLKYKFVKKTIRKLLMLKNKKVAYLTLEACNKRIKY